MNKYKECFDYIVSATNGGEGIAKQLNVIKELVDKATPKKAIKLKEKEYGYTHECPVCHQYVGTVFDDGVEHDDYCCSCGQRLDWGNEDETN